VWIPLCDCPIELGGLASVARVAQGWFATCAARQWSGRVKGVDTSRWGDTWHAQDMQAGDALMFHSYTVHRALVNVSERRLRISVDYRYQGISQPIVEDWSASALRKAQLGPDISGLETAGTSSTTGSKYALRIVPRDLTIMQPEEEYR
jgi:hypothetical protein